MTDTSKLDKTLSHWHRTCILVGLAGVALCGWSASTNLEQFLHSYLVGFLFWWSVSMGCLGLLMLYYLVGGRWGAAARPIAESGSIVVPLTALLFLPVAFGIEHIYPWFHQLQPPGASLRLNDKPDQPTASGFGLTNHTDDGDNNRSPATNPTHITPQKALYLNPPFFYGRAIGYFAVWLVLSTVLGRRTAELRQERTRRRRLLSAGGLVLLVLTVTFAGIDWAMSLDPAWFSSIYGALVAIGGALAAMALVTLTLAAIDCRRSQNERVTSPQALADLGTLLLAFLMLWAYFAFSQFLIIWSGNLPEENVWYVVRMSNGWQWLGLVIVLLQFVVPFFMLLSRELKKSPRALMNIALLVFVMQFWYLLWTIAPSFHPNRIHLHWADVVVPLTIGGLWCTGFLWFVRRRTSQLLNASQP